MPDIVVVVGNPRAGSRTRKLAEALAQTLRQGPFEVLDLAESIGVSFGPEPAYGAKDGIDPFTTVRAAVLSKGLLVVATPAYKGSFTGLLKLFLDQFGHRELAGVSAIPVAVAASPAHAGATASALSDVLAELGAQVAPPLAVTETQLADGDEVLARYAAELSGQSPHLLHGATAS